MRKVMRDAKGADVGVEGSGDGVLVAEIRHSNKGMEVWSPTDVSARRLDCMRLCGILERVEPHAVYMPHVGGGGGLFFGHVANFFMSADFLGISNIEEQGHQDTDGSLGAAVFLGIL
jgi:hypothetical protein